MIQKTILTGDGSPRFYPDGTPRISEIDERIEDMTGRGWQLQHKSPPIVTERNHFDHKVGKAYGAQKRYTGSESRTKVRAVMIRDYNQPVGGGRHRNKHSGAAI